MTHLKLLKEPTKCPKCDAAVFEAVPAGGANDGSAAEPILLNPPAPRAFVPGGRDGRDLRVASVFMRHTCGRYYPNRAYKITVTVQGDTWEDAMRELNHCARHVEQHGVECQLVSGGYSTSAIITVDHDPDMTGDKYRAAIEALNEAAASKE